jgi:hypothetical protein
MSDHGDFREEFHGEHPHSYDHHEPKYKNIWLILGGTVVFMGLTGIVIQAYVNGLWERLTYTKVLSQDSIQLQELRDKEQRELTSFGVADAKTGAMRIPVEQAMKAVVAEAGSPRYPTSPYAVKSAAELAGAAPGVSPAGAAAVNNSQNQGVTSNPNAHQQPMAQQPNK